MNSETRWFSATSRILGLAVLDVRAMARLLEVLAPDERIGNVDGGRKPDTLHFQILAHPGKSAFAAEAAHLESAERRSGARRPIVVDPDGARAQPVGHRDRA